MGFSVVWIFLFDWVLSLFCLYLHFISIHNPVNGFVSLIIVVPLVESYM